MTQSAVKNRDDSPGISVPTAVPASARATSDQQLALEALERIAQKRAAEEAGKREADRVRAQYLLNVQNKLREAETRAREAERKKSEDERMARIRAEHEAELQKCKDRKRECKPRLRKKWGCMKTNSAAC
ncbi:hypothetical protein PHYPSEUDO_013577 [Phytophthora pseudosyringae]|uniref:Uncharacterized protein n=1 Tax=Phytophthora pseudosyringae TaxID=221518 RepID=A0A8T1V8K9_9STRA|nr:hypothetical protein PHYPSEUDO_013577 [Phytophthora pseudosyringae]